MHEGIDQTNEEPLERIEDANEEPQEGAMVKPSTFSELLSSYSHGPDLAIFDCGIYTREST